MSQRDGHLLNNLLLFGRLLHNLGMDTNPGSMIDAMKALEHVQVGQRADFYHTLRSILVRRKEHLDLFEAAFNLFWQRPGTQSLDLNLGDMLQQQAKPEIIYAPPIHDELDESSEEGEEDDDEDLSTVVEITKTFSNEETLRSKDFEQMSQDEIQAVKKLMSQLLWQLGQRKTRRLEVGKKGRILDVRRSIRRSFRHGGEMLELSKLRAKIKPRPLVILADISGSMERYAKLLIHFLYSLAEGLDQRVEVFVFSTRLTRITRQLRNKDADRAIIEAANAVPDWGGGTRIGEAIKTFNFQWGRRVLRGGAITLVISDGWDRGDPLLLGKEMERLQKTSHRVVWLNPLLGSARYEPLTRGIVAALPFVDDFMPVHTLNSLEDLAAHLALLDSGKGLSRKKLSGAAFIGRT
ncbi:MAG: vWA domain-containing protein [Candidatus Promineifilaceae bacterium]